MSGPAVLEQGRTLGGAAAVAYLKRRFSEAVANGEMLPDVVLKTADGGTERLSASDWLSRLERPAERSSITATPNPRYDDTLTATVALTGNSAVFVGGNGTRFDFVTTSMAWTSNKVKAELEKIIHTGRRQVIIAGGPSMYDVTTSDSSGNLRASTSVTYPTTWPSMTIGKECGYIGALTSNHTLRWNDVRFWPLSQPHTSFDNSLASRNVNRPCSPPPPPSDPSSVCDNPSACVNPPPPGGGGAPGPTGLTGTVSVPTAPSGPGGGGSTLVCYFIDWYDVWMDGTWHYRSTDVNGCYFT